MELSEEFKILKNFDIKMVYDKSTNQDSKFKAKIFFEIDRIEFCIDKMQFSDIIDFSQVLNEDTNRICSLIHKSNSIESDFGDKNNTQEIFQANESAPKEYSHTINEETKLIDDESSDDDDKFFDALDESDRNIYSFIKSKRLSIDSSKEEQGFKKSIVKPKDSNSQKIIIISEFRGLTISILQREKNKGQNLTPKLNHVETYTIFKLQMDNFRFGTIQSQESQRFALNLQFFTVFNFEDKILYSKNLESVEEDEESKSNKSFSNNQSYSNNQSITEDYISFREPQNQFLKFSFVQNKNTIIESNSALIVKLSCINFSISQNSIETLFNIIPKIKLNYLNKKLKANKIRKF